MHTRNSLAFVVLMALTACSGGGGGAATPTPPVAPPSPPVGSDPTAPMLETTNAFPSLSFRLPVGLKQAPADNSRWYVVEKRGAVMAFDNDPAATQSDVFLDISSQVNDDFSESGLLGLAFHPQYPAVPEVFVSYNSGTGNALTSVISRFVLDSSGLALDPASEQIVLQFQQPRTNHNGGDLAFGADGFLYASFGDGGGGGDPEENGQDTRNLFGTVIRLDVDSATPYAIPPDNPFAGLSRCSTGSGPSDCAEIYAWGFRNPWRMSFDSATANLWLGDVGQGAWEEINRVELGGNYGWNDREGANCFDPITGCALGFDEPVTQYDHSVGQSVTGGYVYRGTQINDLVGFYVFADFVSGQLFAVSNDAQPTQEPQLVGSAGGSISAFAQDVEQNLYVVSFSTGVIFQVIAAP